jgi:RNA polymerase subunit RPABC4/transcription elongation factor Spt4
MPSLDNVPNVITIIIAFVGAFISALWLSLVIWTFRDMRARSRDIFAALLAALVVAVLLLPGLLIYLILRPRETLAEGYQRALEEEALLQQIETRPVCPGCQRNIEGDWMVCPSCHTHLRKMCMNCGRLNELSWNMCPFCGTPSAEPVPESTAPRRAVAPAPDMADIPDVARADGTDSEFETVARIP